MSQLGQIEKDRLRIRVTGRPPTAEMVMDRSVIGSSTPERLETKLEQSLIAGDSDGKKGPIPLKK